MANLAPAIPTFSFQTVFSSGASQHGGAAQTNRAPNPDPDSFSSSSSRWSCPPRIDTSRTEYTSDEEADRILARLNISINSNGITLRHGGKLTTFKERPKSINLKYIPDSGVLATIQFNDGRSYELSISERDETYHFKKIHPSKGVSIMEGSIGHDPRSLVETKHNPSGGLSYKVAHGVIPKEYRLGDYPVLKELVGEKLAELIDWNRPRTYYETELDFGAFGRTFGDGTVMVNPTIDIDDSPLLDLPVFQEYPKSTVQGTIYNELTEILLQDLDIVDWVAFSSSKGGSPLRSNDVTTWINDITTGNWFTKIEHGIPDFVISNNSQVREFFSDVVNVRVDPNDVFRIIHNSPDFCSYDAYNFSNAFMIHTVTERLSEKGIPLSQIEDFFTRLFKGEVKATDIAFELGFNKSDLDYVRDAYWKMGKKLVGVYEERFAELSPEALELLRKRRERK